MALKNYFVGPAEVYTDARAREQSKRFDVNSYKGAEALPEQLRNLKPFFEASKQKGEIVGLTEQQFRQFISRSKTRLESEVLQGKLRKMQDTLGSGKRTSMHTVYFPTEKTLQTVLDC